MFLRINKKGVVGIAMETLPVLLAVFFLMIIFLVLVGFASFLGPQQPPTPYSNNLAQDSFLLKSINVNGVNMTVFDEIMFLDSDGNIVKNKNTLDFFNDFLITKPTNMCFFLFNGKPESENLIFDCKVSKDASQDAEDKLVNGQKNKCDVTIASEDYEKFITDYSDKLNTISFNINNKESEISYYYGKCLV